MKRMLIAVAAAAGLGFAAPALAQDDYPNRPVRVIVPQPPGGGFDFVARALAEKLGPLLGQPVTVENRTGAGTLVGTEAAAKSAPDGYTLLMGSVSNIALNPGLYRNLPYDPLRDFEPVGLAVSYSYTLVGRKDLPFETLQQLIDHARANPGKLTYASAGNGSGQHVLAAVLWHQAGVNLTHVPYRGAQAAYTDLIGGRVDVFFDLSSTARPLVDGDRVKPFAVSGSARNPMHPNVPTVSETGVAPVELESWFGYFAPAKTPRPVLERLRAGLANAIRSPDLVERFERAGGKPLALSAAETDALVRRDVQTWTKLIREVGIQAD